MFDFLGAVVRGDICDAATELPGRWFVRVPSSTQLRVEYFYFYFRNGRYSYHTDELCGDDPTHIRIQRSS